MRGRPQQRPPVFGRPKEAIGPCGDVRGRGCPCPGDQGMPARVGSSVAEASHNRHSSEDEEEVKTRKVCLMAINASRSKSDAEKSEEKSESEEDQEIKILRDRQTELDNLYAENIKLKDDLDLANEKIIFLKTELCEAKQLGESLNGRSLKLMDITSTMNARLNGKLGLDLLEFSDFEDFSRYNWPPAIHRFLDAQLPRLSKKVKLSDGDVGAGYISGCSIVLVRTKYCEVPHPEADLGICRYSEKINISYEVLSVMDDIASSEAELLMNGDEDHKESSILDMKSSSAKEIRRPSCLMQCPASLVNVQAAATRAVVEKTRASKVILQHTYNSLSAGL
ncbi:hypothetical protein KSP39_PZI011393 [Platanthera zijinensis]|uniref:Uncharacterized protein n=1 Tax=Platanthera zijinensis TaxID=2320716 RepID=A0AAP0BG15_9ASPA